MATTRLSTYAPQQVTVVITQDTTGLSHILGGYSEDGIVSVDRNVEAYTLYTGADDSNTRVKNSNSSGTITINLQQSSASNDILHGLFLEGGIFTITVKDASGRSNYFSDEAYVGDVPGGAFSNSLNTRDWVIHAPKMSEIIGGNSRLSPEDAAALEQLGVNIEDRWL